MGPCGHTIKYEASALERSLEFCGSSSGCLRRGLSEPRGCKGLACGGAGSGSPPCLLMPLPALALPWGAAATLTGAPPAGRSSMCRGPWWVTFLHAGQDAGSGRSSSRCHKRWLTSSAVPRSVAPLSSCSDQLSLFSAA